MARKRRKSTTKGNSTQSIILIVVVLVVGAFLADYFLGTDFLGSADDRINPPQESNQPEQPTTGDSGVTTYFTTPSLVYPDRKNQRGASPLLDAVLADVAGAKQSIDLAVFDIDLESLTDGLIAAQERGVTVRLVVDSENLETAQVADMTGRMQDAGIEISFDDREPFMHNKFIVLDQEIAWLGSWNMTENDTYRNNNNMLRFPNRQIAEDYHNEFEQLFAGTFGTSKASATPNPRVQLGSTTVEVFFSPQDGIAEHVLAQIEQAEQSIRFMTFSYTSDDIAAAMIAKLDAGLTVQGVFERQNAEGTGAEFNTLKSGGVDVLEDGNCYILHHKVILIDDQIVITGSYNFTASAERSNDENLVIINDPAIARAYQQEFERLYALAENPTRCQ